MTGPLDVKSVIGGQANYNNATSAGGTAIDSKLSAGVKVSSASDNHYWNKNQPDIWGSATADISTATLFTLYSAGSKPVIGGATLEAGYNSFTSNGSDGLYGSSNASFTGALPLAGGPAQRFSSTVGGELGFKKDFDAKYTGGVGAFGSYTDYAAKNDPMFRSNIASGVRFTFADTSKSDVVKFNLDAGGKYDIASKQVKPHVGLGATLQFKLGGAK